MSNSNNKLEYGDYQTPLDFCMKIVEIIKKDVIPTVIFEPTFGIGNFLKASIKSFDNIKLFLGNEINEEYYNNFSKEVADKNIKLYNDNIFSFNHKLIRNELDAEDNLLILGNPPWVTNSQLMSESMKNLPKKSNIKNLKGFDSITGASNFDICEYIILDLLNNYKDTNATIAMLCKTSVATNIIKNIKNYKFKIRNSKMYLFNAQKIFDVSCEACLFITTLNNDVCENTISVYDLDNPNKKKYSSGWHNNKFYSKINNNKYDIDGEFFTQWRQGIKHDCSKVMELEKNICGAYINKLKETVDLEDKFIYKFLKSSDLKDNVISTSKRYVIVPQKKIKEETMHIKDEAPKTWQYLNAHIDFFNNRKSSIYNNCPPFSIFGIGDYSFAKYKVAISGFYKEPKFVYIKPNDNKDIMLDDTCYFIGFNNEKDAIITMILLNSDITRDFLSSIAFIDKKRPYTKDILMRIDIRKILTYIDFSEFSKIYSEYNFGTQISENDYKKYISEFSYNTQLSII